MNSVSMGVVETYIESKITRDVFDKKLAKLRSVTWESLIDKSMPYLANTGNGKSACAEILQSLERTMRTHEELLYNQLLKNLAIYICKKVRGGRKSTIPGIDVEFSIGRTQYFVAIGAWHEGNEFAIKGAGLLQDAVRTKASNCGNRVLIHGYLYGNYNTRPRNGKQTLSGKLFWALMSGRSEFYRELIDPLQRARKLESEEYRSLWDQKTNLILGDFLNRFLSHDKYSIDQFTQYCSHPRNRRHGNNSRSRR